MLAKLLNVISLGYRTKLLLIRVFLKMYMKVMMTIVNSTYKLLSNYYVSRSRSNALQTSYFSQKKNPERIQSHFIAKENEVQDS